jgi:hypothetical protein
MIVDNSFNNKSPIASNVVCFAGYSARKSRENRDQSGTVPFFSGKVIPLEKHRRRQQ